MKKYYFHSLLTIGFVLITHFLIAQNSVILTSGAGVWKPPPGVKSFYVQLWGGGAGGNAEWAQGQFGYNGTGGGGGSSFSQSIVYIVTAAKQASGYGYKVGVGGALNQDGTNSFFENCFAIEGYRSGLERRKSPIAGEVAVSNFGGIGGQSWRNIFDNRWQGGGGGSGRTNGEAAGGQTAGDGFHGYGGDGAGGGGKTGDYAAGAPGGGGSGDQAGARGEIRIFYTCDYTPGTIGNAHTVPYLPELPAGTDFITNVTSPTGFGYTYSWESSTDNVIWTILPGANQITLPIPAIQSNTYVRRVINGCGTNNTSNSVLIKVFSQGNGKKNGVISGKVTSKNGITAVPGVTITVQKTVSLKGSPQSFPYTKVTESDGTYTINPIFYGDNSIEGGDPDNVSFTIIASKAGHKLSTRNPVTLSNIIPTSTGNNFIDSTVYSITGRVTQTCDGCLFGSRGPYGVGNVKISSNDQTVTAVYSDSLRADSIGYFGITVADPQSYTFTAAFLNHKFVPPSQSFTITNDTSNINFSDTSTRLISGKLTDMAGKRIGSAIIKFVGILQRKDSTIVTTFQDTANINTGDSSYSVRLPTGTYKVTIDAFTPAYPSNDARYIPQSDVTDFFNVRVIEPLINISTKDSVRNLVYHRTPVFVINGLKDTACNIDQNKNPGIVFRTNAPKQFQVYVFEGPPSLGNRMQVTSGNNQPDTLSDYIRFYTSITQRSSIANADTIFFRLKNAFTGPMIDSFFIPGAPNTIAPFTKPFEVHYTDRYGRKATSFKPKTTVVGVFNPTQTFTTAFPEIPFLILHAPPGDQSYSFWSKDSSTALTKSWSVGSDKGNDAFVNVSLGGTIGLSEGPVSIDVQVIATGNYTHENHVNSGLTDEIESTVTTNQKFQTSKSLRVTGNSGDVYIGNGTNYKLGNSIYVDFKQGTPVGACEIEKDVKLIIGVDTFRTEFAYAEDHIVNVIIPQQDRVSREATDPVKRAEAANQVKVWQQVIDNNKINKKIAGSSRNRSFSHGVIIEESETNSKSATNTITYDVLLGNNFAYELGLRVANVGVSGGGMITMRETWGNSTINNRSSATTMGYHLEDDDIGDFYSTDIKKDPVYGTPVFELVAGTSSCPVEQGAQNRDQPQIVSGDMRFDSLNVNTPKFFNISLTNKSESGEPRNYELSVDAATSDGLVISSSESPNLAANNGSVIFYNMPFEATQNVQIKVEKFNQNDKVFSYPNVEFYLTDNCGVLPVPNTISTSKISFNYASACGGIALAAPSNGWVVNTSNNNILPITMNGYTLSNIDSITLQYKKQGTAVSVWQSGFTIKKAGITDSSSYTYPFNIAGLLDTTYNLRLRLVCQNGDIIYSAVASGVTDRKAPSLVGTPQPVTQLYNPDRGEISFSYNESISNGNLNQGVVELVRRSNNTLVPISVNEVAGKLIITPLNSLGNTIDSFRVIVKNIADVYGNEKVRPDTSFFKLDLTPLVTYTGSNVATVYVSPDSIAENSTGKMELHFKLREITNKITRVYFNLSGSALYSTDYRISYDTIRKTICADSACTRYLYSPVYNQFSDSPGYVNIDSNKTEAVISIYPIVDFENEPDETIRVQLVSGPDYKLQDSVLATATILNSGAACPQSNILYVNRNATGNNSGISWLNAMTSLQNALASNCPGITQIWVARGTYKPTTNTSRDSSFALKNNLTIYGGFAGTETALSQRNIRLNPTILSGDIGIANSNSDNSYNVVRNVSNGLNSTAVLDGFVVTGGNGNGGGFGGYGAGIINVNSTPSFYNCSIIGNNAAIYGGGMYNNGTSPLVVNSIFAGNTAQYGGGLYNESAATKLINCSFSGNLAFAEGGAISTYGAVVPQIINSILWGNSSGIRNAGGSAPAVTYSIVQGGYAGTGNLNVDPLFILQPAPALGNTGDLRVQGCSPTVNGGSNGAFPAGVNTDLASLPRVANTTIDMGAYERQLPATSVIIYVDATATGNNSGENWANAYNNLSSAITELNFCSPGTTIQVAAGTYTAALNTTYNFDKLGASILGGYPTGGGTRNPDANPVIVKGNVQVLKSVRIDGIRVQKQ